MQGSGDRPELRGSLPEEWARTRLLPVECAKRSLGRAEPAALGASLGQNLRRYEASRWQHGRRYEARLLDGAYGVRGRNKSTNEAETLNDSGGTTCVAADAATNDSARPMIPMIAHRAGRGE
jgi:hypothetical protein